MYAAAKNNSEFSSGQEALHFILQVFI